MSLIAELQRGKVFKVGAAYLVGAWLFVQVAGTLLPMFGAPAWVARIRDFVTRRVPPDVRNDDVRD
jgi:hypothetical protein